MPLHAGRPNGPSTLTVNPNDKVSGSGISEMSSPNGVQLPLRDVLHLMIVLSDNTATNMILERFSANAVNAYLDKTRPTNNPVFAQSARRWNSAQDSIGLVGSRQASRKPEIWAGRIVASRDGHDSREAREAARS